MVFKKIDRARETFRSTDIQARVRHNLKKRLL